MDPRDLTKIRTFLVELLRDHDDDAGFADTDSLVNSGRLDSLAVVKLVSMKERLPSFATVPIASV